MTRATVFLALSWVALFVALAAVVVSAIPGGGQLMGWFMFDHVLVLVVFIAGSWVLRRSALPLRWPGARRLFAPWLVVTACVAVGAMLTLHVVAPVDVLLPSGHHLRLVANDVTTAMARAPAGRADQGFGVFAHVWVVFALAALCLWHVIGLRDEQARTPPPLAMTATGASMSPRERADADDRLAAWRPVLIAAIWASGLTWSGLGVWFFLPRDRCAPPFPWPFAILPLVFFPLSGLFAKRAPYDVPWFAELVDSRFGAGAWARFLVSLKPMLLLAAGSLCASLVLLQRCDASVAGLPFMPLFMASGGIGFLLFHVVLRLRRIDGA